MGDVFDLDLSDLSILNPMIFEMKPSRGIVYENLNDTLRGITNMPNTKGIFYKFITTGSDKYYRIKVLITRSEGIYFLPEKLHYTLGPVIIDSFDIPKWLAYPNEKTIDGVLRVLLTKTDRQSTKQLCKVKEMKDLWEPPSWKYLEKLYKLWNENKESKTVYEILEEIQKQPIQNFEGITLDSNTGLQLKPIILMRTMKKSTGEDSIKNPPVFYIILSNDTTYLEKTDITEEYQKNIFLYDTGDNFDPDKMFEKYDSLKELYGVPEESKGETKEESVEESNKETKEESKKESVEGDPINIISPSVPSSQNDKQERII